jgi:hypothetical protein
MPLVRIPEHVLFRSFGDEAVLLNLHTGQYHGLNSTGGRMFELLAACGDTDEVVAAVASDFGLPSDEVVRDLADLCSDLADRGLIEIEPPVVDHDERSGAPGA